ncbi:hypothetical protein TNCV_2784091 [Trichonephila clavipes]|nr:hypothetical protein TNCV_2784091 [Trichonephila clavipes]
MFSLVFLQSPSQVKLTMTVLLRAQQTDQELHTLIASGTSLELKRSTSFSKEDILCTPAELVFGTTIRLPGRCLTLPSQTMML